MKESMEKLGYNEGNMSAKVENFQKPEKDYPERGFSKTTEYIERQNATQSAMSKDVEKQHYKGRYS